MQERGALSMPILDILKTCQEQVKDRIETARTQINLHIQNVINSAIYSLDEQRVYPLQEKKRLIELFKNEAESIEKAEEAGELSLLGGEIASYYKKQSAVFLAKYKIDSCLNESKDEDSNEGSIVKKKRSKEEQKRYDFVAQGILSYVGANVPGYPGYYFEQLKKATFKRASFSSNGSSLFLCSNAIDLNRTYLITSYMFRRKITRLSLRSCSIDDDAAEVLSHLDLVETLDLGRNSIGPRGAQHIASNVFFKEVLLSHNCIEAGVEAFSDNKSIETLDVSYNNIPEKSLSTLIRRNKTITELDITGNRASLLDMLGALSKNNSINRGGREVAKQRADEPSIAALARR
jgi:hypothetical protein